MVGVCIEQHHWDMCMYICMYICMNKKRVCSYRFFLLTFSRSNIYKYWGEKRPRHTRVYCTFFFCYYIR